MAKSAPGIAQWIPLPVGALGELQRDLTGFQLKLFRRYGDVVRFRMGPLLAHFLFHPDHVKRVFQDEHKNYQRGWQYRMLGRLLGQGLVVTDGEFWLRQRRLVQPAFHRQRLAGYVESMADVTAELLDDWERTAGAPLDLRAEMSRLTLAIICRTMFGRIVKEEAAIVARSFGVMQSYLEMRLHHPFACLPVWAPTPRNRRFREALLSLDRIVYAIINQRRSYGREQGNLLSILLHAQDDVSGARMTDRQLRDEALTFFVAGHETTAIALTWTWYLLASHPEAMQQVCQEVKTVLAGRRPGIEDLARLDYTRMAIEESMRLYPPVHTLVRAPLADDEVGGYLIPAGSNVILSQYITHRHPDFWERPEVFDPERFTPERVAQRPKYAYFPFIGGPHQCIGNEFAMLEARLVVAMLVQRFRLELIAGQTVETESSLGLVPRHPIQVRLCSGA